jgi:uncharacterized protein DUF3159
MARRGFFAAWRAVGLPANHSHQTPSEPGALSHPATARVPRSHARRTSRRRIDSPGGILLSSLPSAALAPLNAIGGPATAVVCAAVLATFIAVARVRRGHPHGPAFGGLVGVSIAGFAAWATGSGSGLFLPDLAWYLAAAVVLAGSVVVRRPLVGVGWSLVVRPARPRAARSRAFSLATGLLAAMFAARFVVTRLLQAHPTDPWLVALKVASGFPLTVAGLGVIAWAWHRARPTVRRGPVRSYCPGHP